MTLPPGTILQLMYLKDRLRNRQPGSFIEIGVGQGYVSACLLSLGWRGVGYEVDAEAAGRAAALNSAAIAEGRYRVAQENWLEAQTPRPDLIVSSMVLEHVSDEDEARYLRRCGTQLNALGLCILFVPGSPGDWGVEDEIAGHYRRYGYTQLRELLERSGCRAIHMAGLTYPLSNWLLPVSNYFVRRAESGKQGLTLEQRTRSSGRRDVLGKTRFPSVAGLVLNEVVLYPFHLLQKAAGAAGRALVIYCEFEPGH